MAASNFRLPSQSDRAPEKTLVTEAVASAMPSMKANRQSRNAERGHEIDRQ